MDEPPTGVDAPLRATAAALAAAASARAVLLVEGISDQVAVQALAARHGRDLAAEHVVVLPIGGAHGAARYVTRFGPRGSGVLAGGLVDAGEEAAFRRGLDAGGLELGDDLEALGFFVCHRDLEDELLRAAGPALVEAVLDREGDLPSFRSLQRQPAWRGQDVTAQLHRYLAAGASRKVRYAGLLVRELPLDRMPRPLTALLRRV